MPSVRTAARMLHISRSFSVLAGLIALLVLVFFGLNLWMSDFEVLFLLPDVQALCFSLIAALLVILSTWMTIRFLHRFAQERVTVSDFKRRTLLLWVLFIPIVLLSGFSIYLFFQMGFSMYFYDLLVASILGMLGLQLIFVLLWTIVILSAPM